MFPLTSVSLWYRFVEPQPSWLHFWCLTGPWLLCDARAQALRGTS